MRTRDFIRELMARDPEGDGEVSMSPLLFGGSGRDPWVEVVPGMTETGGVQTDILRVTLRVNVEPQLRRFAERLEAGEHLEDLLDL